MPLLLHEFGGLTPMNVWEMRHREFLILARYVDRSEGGLT